MDSWDWLSNLFEACASVAADGRYQVQVGVFISTFDTNQGIATMCESYLNFIPGGFSQAGLRLPDGMVIGTALQIHPNRLVQIAPPRDPSIDTYQYLLPTG